MVIVTLIDRDSVRINEFFDSVNSAQAFADYQKEIGARKIRISVR